MESKENKFAAFILSHGRPDNVRTYKTLRSSGYTGKIYIIIDNEDKRADEYFRAYKDEVIMFDKLAVSKTFDEADNFDNRKTIVYARNASFKIAEELGLDNFIQLDDDYTSFSHRTAEVSKKIMNLDNVFKYLVDYVNDTPSITTICFSQGGDHIGGYVENKKVKRKAMNSFVCSTKKPFQFVGRINEDVNTYVRLGSLGDVMFTINNIQLNQVNTQQSGGGMTDIYLIGGTYIKSFYSVIINPSSVKVKTIGAQNPRMHHAVSWNNAVPCIISEDYKKK